MSTGILLVVAADKIQYCFSCKKSNGENPINFTISSGPAYLFGFVCSKKCLEKVSTFTPHTFINSETKELHGFALTKD